MVRIIRREGLAQERSPQGGSRSDTGCLAAGHIVWRITHEDRGISRDLQTFERFQHGFSVWLRVPHVVSSDKDFKEAFITSECQSPFEPTVHLARHNAQAIPRSM